MHLFAFGDEQGAGPVLIHPVVLLGVLGVGRTAHHAQHSEPSGADESDDQRGREEEEDDVQPGGVVPRHAWSGSLALAGLGIRPRPPKTISTTYPAPTMAA